MSVLSTGAQYEKVLLVLTDAAPYMNKSMRGLQLLYYKMVHVTCAAHGLHRVAEIIRSAYPKVNYIISSTKNVFLNAPTRRERFFERSGGISLPPAPITTRWGSWISAVIYYANNFNIVKQIVDEFDPEERKMYFRFSDRFPRMRVKRGFIIH